MTYAVELKNLSKKYGTKTAVKGSNLKVAAGSLFSLLGVNGAGKTTTIRMLTGLTKPTAGDAIVGGYHITSDLSKVKQLCGISTQETAIAPNLTVWENLLFMAQIYGMNARKARVSADTVIQDLSLAEVKNSKAKTLSGGWQRRLSIAMALITKPQILFLDEPTLGLDVLARNELWQVIAALKGKITIILTTHYMEEAQQLSDQVAIMTSGEVRACGSVADLKQLTHTNSLEEAFVAIAESEGSL